MNQKILLLKGVADHIQRTLFDRMVTAHLEYTRGDKDETSWTSIASSSIREKVRNRSAEAEYFSRGIANPVTPCHISDRGEKIFSANCAVDYFSSKMRRDETTLLDFIRAAQDMFNHGLYTLVLPIAYHSIHVLWLQQNEHRSQIDLANDHDLYESLLLLTESYRAIGKLELSTLFSGVMMAYSMSKGSLHLLFRLRTILSLPPVPPDYEEAQKLRAEMIEDLMLLREDVIVLGLQLSLADLMEEVTSTPFYMAHQGLNDREFMEALFEVFLTVCPELRYTAPLIEGKTELKQNKSTISIGFISNYFYDQSIGRILLNTINNLVQDPVLDVYVFFIDRELIRRNTREDSISRYYAQILNDKFIRVSPLTVVAREEIGNYALDFIVFADIGMDFSTYSLAFSRLATYQIAWWGHPITTGIPTIDFYFGLDIEVARADSHYSEQLIRMVRYILKKLYDYITYLLTNLYARI